MTRTLFALVVSGVALAISTSVGCGQTGVGDPCTPEQEYDPQFNGFDEKEVNVESKSFQCQTRLCLVNHYRGRSTCPFGQNAEGSAPTGHQACTVPGTSTAITGRLGPNGEPADTKRQKQVCSECTDRTADKAVYCSCRCANLKGETNDGANYCTCPEGFVCEQLVTSIGIGNEGLTGAYCIKQGTKYDPANACASYRDPNTPCR